MSHYYDTVGNSKHELIGANGKLRGTTIADARKLGLVPSVTTVMDVQAKPALIMWLQGQILDAVIKTPYHPHEWDAELYKTYILSESRRVGREAADKGTDIHNRLDQYFITKKKPKADLVYIEPVLEALNAAFGSDVEWISEEGFAHASGFGGRVDLHSKSHNIIVDFKTKDKEDIKAVKAYDDHKIQLAAYQAGLRLPLKTRRYNLFISTAKGHEGECNLVEAKDFDNAWDMFESLLTFWKAKNKYDPSLAFPEGVL